MKKITGLLIFIVLFFSSALIYAAEGYINLPGQGKKILLNDGFYLNYTFSKKPSMGTLVMKIKVYDKNGKQTSKFKIYGDSGMPSMKGHHESGEAQFKLNKKGDYLLPVNIVMPGDWEIRIKILDKKKIILKGAVNFDV